MFLRDSWLCAHWAWQSTQRCLVLLALLLLHTSDLEGRKSHQFVWKTGRDHCIILCGGYSSFHISDTLGQSMHSKVSDGFSPRKSVPQDFSEQSRTAVSPLFQKLMVLSMYKMPNYLLRVQSYPSF